MSQRATVVPVPSGDGLLSVDEAASSIGLTGDQLVRALAGLQVQLQVRQREPTDLPPPRPDEPPTWARRPWTLWTLRMGWAVTEVDGVAVIGYLGLAHQLGVREQSLRKAALRRTGRDPLALPAPRFRMCDGDGSVAVALFDRSAVLRWAVQTGRLPPGHVIGPPVR